MSPDTEKCYEILGAKPGASAQELKAAYKDMAKVWHPDRFAHDPPLQQKAQEKLKEINEAYAHLTSRNSVRSSRTAPTPQGSRAHGKRAHAGDKLTYAAMLVFAISFLLALSLQAFNSRPGGRGQDTSLSETASTTLPEAVKTEQGQADERPRTLSNNDQTPTGNNRPLKLAERPEQAETPVPQLRPLPTVTVSIDPFTGLVATANCPLKQSMTFPKGSEPQQPAREITARPAPRHLCASRINLACGLLPSASSRQRHGSARRKNRPSTKERAHDNSAVVI